MQIPGQFCVQINNTTSQTTASFLASAQRSRRLAAVRTSPRMSPSHTGRPERRPSARQGARKRRLVSGGFQLAQGAALDDCLAAEPSPDRICGPFGSGTSGGIGVKQVGAEVGLRLGGEVADPDTDQPEGTLRCQGEQVVGGAVDAVGQLGRIGQAVAAGDGMEIAAFEFQGHGAAGQLLGLGAVGDLFGEAPDVAVQQVGVGGVLVEGGFLADRLQLFIPHHPPGVLTPRQGIQPVAHLAEAGPQVLTGPAEEVGDGADACGFQCGLGGGADAPDDADGFGFQERLGLGPPDDREAAGFVEVGGDLGEVFVVGQAHRAGQAQLGFHVADQAGQHDGGGGAVEAGGAGQVEEGFVEGEGFDGGGEGLHQGADGAACFDVGGEVGFHDDGLGAELQGLEHRHRGADAVDSGEVAAGRDDAPGAAADDDGLIPQGGVIPLFNAGIKGVAVHVGDGEGFELGVGKQTGAAAGGAARAGLELGQAIAAEGGHDGGSIGGFGGCGKGRFHARNVRYPIDLA